MKKAAIVGLVVVIVGLGGWLVAREHFACANADASDSWNAWLSCVAPETIFTFAFCDAIASCFSAGNADALTWLVWPGLFGNTGKVTSVIFPPLIVTATCSWP